VRLYSWTSPRRECREQVQTWMSSKYSTPSATLHRCREQHSQPIGKQGMPTQIFSVKNILIGQRVHVHVHAISMCNL
jgi:hypothetical protein